MIEMLSNPLRRRSAALCLWMKKPGGVSTTPAWIRSASLLFLLSFAFFIFASSSLIASGDFEDFFWFNGTFLECKPVEKFRKAHLNLSKEEQEHLRKLRRALTLMTVLMKRLRLPAFLGGGTLLGWRRECGLIAHTTDIDFALPVQYFTPELLRLFRSLSQPYLRWEFSDAAMDSLELSFVWETVKIDLFAAYPLPDRRPGFYLPGTISYKKTKLRWLYPLPRNPSLCRGVLEGVEVNLPCQASRIILLDYGANWTEPIAETGKNAWSWESSAPNLVSLPPVSHSLYREYRQKIPNPQRDRRLIDNYLGLS